MCARRRRRSFSALARARTRHPDPPPARHLTAADLAERPDFINARGAPTGASGADNWLQKKHDGSYVPDDYADDRLVMYDDLFNDWEKWLRFAIQGKDAPNESKE